MRLPVAPFHRLFSVLIQGQGKNGLLLQRIFWGANLNADLPVSGHRQVPSHTEAPLAIGEQVEALRSHSHIEHGGIDRHTNIRVWLVCTLLSHRHNELILAEAIRVDSKGYVEFAVRRTQGSCIDLCYRCGLL